MKKTKLSSILSVFLALVIALSCLALTASAKTISIIKLPNDTMLYEGIDWLNAKNSDGSKEISIIDLSLAGTQIQYGDKTITFAIKNSLSNMSFSRPTGGWKVGVNTVKIYCNEFESTSEYAEINFTLVEVQSISVYRLPAKTVLVKDVDWNEGLYLHDVEITKYDITGAAIKATFTDGVVKTVSYPENTRLGWSVSQDIDYFYPGENTMYLTYCGKSAPFKMTFVNETVHAIGDVNIDNKITSYDALLVLQYSTGLATLNSAQLTNADVTKDGTVNSSDALQILQFIVGSRLAF